MTVAVAGRSRHHRARRQIWRAQPGHGELVADVGDHRRASRRRRHRPRPARPGRGDGWARPAPMPHAAGATTAAISIDRARPSMPVSTAVARDAVAQRHVEHEDQGAIGEGEGEPKRMGLPGCTSVRGPDTSTATPSARALRRVRAPRAARAIRPGGTRWPPTVPSGRRGDGQVEAAVHRGQGVTPRARRESRRCGHVRLTAKRCHGPAPRREENRRGAGDAQPGHAERRDVGEEQYGESGAEIWKTALTRNYLRRDRRWLPGPGREAMPSGAVFRDTSPSKLL